MTINYLSFASIAALSDNNGLTVSDIGELSTKSKTYTKDPSIFSLADDTTTVLYNFSTMSGDEEVAMTQAVAEIEINISNWLYSQASKGNITASKANCLALLKSTFTSNIEWIDVGDMATNGVIYLPSFIHGYHIDGEDKNEFYVWYSDPYFRIQYPKVEFIVVHPVPIEDIDQLADLNYQQLQERLAKETQLVVSEREHKLTNDSEYPYTERDVLEFNIYDLTNTPNYVVGSWIVLTYGNGADAEDQLYEQIQDEILANSEYPREKWEDIIPDLFNPTEYYAVPYFDRLGIKNRINGSSTYSPIVDRETEMDLVNFYITPNMNEPHVIKSMQVVPFLYKSLACAFVGKVNNRDGYEKIDSWIPDYQLIPSSDSDFDTMSEFTRDFILDMENLFAAAEVVTPTSIPPAGITRIERFGKVCVSKHVGKSKMIVITRWQYVEDGLLES